MNTITVDVDELDEHGAMWVKYPELFKALDCVRVHDLVRLTMAEAGITPYGIAYDQDARVLYLDIPSDGVGLCNKVHRALQHKLAILAVVAPGVTVKVETL